MRFNSKWLQQQQKRYNSIRCIENLNHPDTFDDILEIKSLEGGRKGPTPGKNMKKRERATDGPTVTKCTEVC